MNLRTTEAKASFTSNRSMSESFMSARSSAFSAAGIGPVSMIVGSEPVFEVATIRARGLMSDRSPNALSPSSTAAAPSTIPEELPA